MLITKNASTSLAMEMLKSLNQEEIKNHFFINNTHQDLLNKSTAKIPKMSFSEISQFYIKKSIFCTGATGFMGKVLIEKLLRDCPELSTIYILIRGKKGTSPKERFANYVNDIVFDKIRDKNPDQFKKLKVIKGDVTMDNLGIDINDRTELIENVNIIFHCAANVRFDMSLREAVNFNLNGTHHVMQLAEKMKNLKALVHVSTTYCHCDQEILEEQFYETVENPFAIMDLVKTLSDDTLESLTPKLLRTLPNTYSLSKGLAENLVYSYRNKFPIVIARSSIVTGALKEPYPGYIEGTNGPTGLLIAAGKGVLRTMHMNADIPAEMIPVDININAFIALAHKRTLIENDEVLFCNISDNGLNPLTWRQTLDDGKEILLKYPTTFALWYPGGSPHTNFYIHMINVLLFHYIPAYFIDGLLYIAGYKTFMVRVQNKLSRGLEILQYYTIRRWVFKNSNLKALNKDMNEIDKERFSCDVTKINYDDYMISFVMGIKKFILKETEEDLPKARTLFKRLYILDIIVKVIFLGATFYWLYTYINKYFGFSPGI